MSLMATSGMASEESPLRGLASLDRFEPNNTSSAAANLGPLFGVNGVSSVTIYNSGDVDWYRFELPVTGGPGNGIVVETASHGYFVGFDIFGQPIFNPGNVELAVFDEANNSVFAYTGATFAGSASISVQGWFPGRYWIRVRDVNQVGNTGIATGNYALSLVLPNAIAADLLEPNDLIGVARPLLLQNGEWFRNDLTIHAPNNDDWYSLVMGGSGTDTHGLRIEFDNRAGNLGLELFNQAGTRIRFSNNNTDFEQISFEGVAAGTYYIHVYGNGHTSRGYSLQVSVATRQLDAREPNDLPAAAATLEFDPELEIALEELSLHTGADQDWFKITTTAQTTWDHFAQVLYDPFLGSVDLALYDSGGNLLNWSFGNGYLNVLPLGGLPPGTYYLQVFSFAGLGSPLYYLGVFAPTRALGPDEFEPNETLENPAALGVVSGLQRWERLSIHDSGDVDVFSFEITGAGDWMHYAGIEFLNGQGNLDLALFDAEGWLLNFSGFGGDLEWVSLWNLPPGKYLLAVYGFNGGANPEYRLEIAAPGVSPSIAGDRYEQNNSRGEVDGRPAGQVHSPHLASRAGLYRIDRLTIHSSSDVDWFRFELSEAGKRGHFLAIEHDYFAGDLDLSLYEEDGTLLESAAGLRALEEISLQGRAAGVYYARVSGYEQAVHPSYALLFNLPGDDPYEPNDAMNEDENGNELLDEGEDLDGDGFLDRAWNLDLGGTSGTRRVENLSISRADDVDWFKFALGATGSRDQFVRIEFEHAEGNLELELYDEAGRQLRSSATVANKEQISLEGLPSADVYYIKARGSDGALNPWYSLLLKSTPGGAQAGDPYEPNNSRQSARELRPLQARSHGPQVWFDAQQPASIHEEGDEDWFEFTLAEPGRAGHYAAIQFDHTLGDIDLEFYDRSGAMLDSSTGAANTHSVNLNQRPAGTYYLRVAGYKASTVQPSYALVINGTWSAPTGDSFEENDSIGQPANLGTINGSWQRQNLSIHETGDEDWYLFTTTEAGGQNHFVAITFSHGNGDLDLALYDQSGLLETSETISGTERISLQALSGGSYLIQVAGHQEATNPDYTLRIDAPEGIEGDWAERPEPNNAATDAFDLRQVKGVQSWPALSIHRVGDEDWFKFTMVGDAAEGHQVGIQFNHFEGDLDLIIYDETGETELGSSRTADTVERVVLRRLTNRGVQGTYLARVVGHNKAVNPAYQLFMNVPDYTVGDWAEANNSEEAAHDLQEVQGGRSWGGLSLHAAGDEDWFQFRTIAEGVDGHSVSILFDHTRGDLSLTVIAPDGSMHHSESIGDREEVSLAGPVAPGNPFLVRVHAAGAGGTSPEYALVVQAPQRAEADWAEANDALADATELRTIDGALSISSLSIHESTDEDWFKFNLETTPLPGHFARIGFNRAEGALVLELFDRNGEPIGISTGDGNEQEISLSGNGAGDYFLKVSGLNGNLNPDYALTIRAHPALLPDAAEENNTPGNAYDLRMAPSISKQSRIFVSGGLGYGENYGGAGLIGTLFGAFGGMNPVTSPPPGNHFPGAVGSTLFPNSPNPTNPQDPLQLLTALGYLGNNQFGASAMTTGLNTIGATLLGQGSPLQIGNQIYGPQFGQNFQAGLGSILNHPELQGALSTGLYGIPGLGSNGPLFGGTTSLLSPGASVMNTFNPGLFNTANPMAVHSPLGNMPSQFVNPLDYLALAGLNTGPYATASGGGLPFGISSFLGLPYRSGTGEFVSMAGLSIHEEEDVDWFRVELAQDGTAEEFVAISFDHSLGDLQLELFEAFPVDTPSDGQEGYLVERSNGSGSGEEISLAGLVQGAYVLRVSGVSGAVNPSYSLVFSAAVKEELEGDTAEPNNTPEEAYDLRLVDGQVVIGGLTIHEREDADWIRFTTGATGRQGDGVRIEFSHRQGDLELELYNDSGSELLDSSTSAGDAEEVSLDDLGPGTYLLKVFGYAGATSPSYRLVLTGPDTTVRPDLLEPNNTFSGATDLESSGTLTGLSALTIHAGAAGGSDDDVDCFGFRIPEGAQATESHYVRVQSQAQLGDLELELYRGGQATPVLVESTAGEPEDTISLAGLAPGEYYAVVSGAAADTAMPYELRLDLPQATPLATGPARDHWTVMIYMTASDLAPFAFFDVNEMELAAAELPGTVNLAVLWDQSSKPLPRYNTVFTFATGSETTPWGDTGRAIIKPDRDGHKEIFARKVVTTFERIGEQNTGNPQTLSDFINWAAAAAPAENYALILWDHGGGDLYGFNTDDFDDHPADRLTTDELTGALGGLAPDIRSRVKLLSFDACLMAMLEVAHALRDHSTILVASQEVEGGDGYDYETAFSSMFGNPGATAEQVASGIVQSYYLQYKDSESGEDTHSATSLQPLSGQFIPAFKIFCDRAVTSGSADDWDVLRQVRNRATSFHQSPDYRDLGQYLEGVAFGQASAGLRAAAQNALDALRASIIAKTADRRRTEGLSIYLPASGSIANPNYLLRNSSFLAESGWGAFLDVFVGGTDRFGALGPDWAESNDVFARAFNLRALGGAGNRFSGLSLHQAQDQDWFRFLIEAPAEAGNGISLSHAPESGPVGFALLDRQKNLIDQTTSSAGSAVLALPVGMAAGEYFIRVENSDWEPVLDYSIQVDAPSSGQTRSDWALGNDVEAKAWDLGVVASRTLFPGLTTDSGAEAWFQFQTPRSQIEQPGRIRIVSNGSAQLSASLYEPGAPFLLESAAGAGEIALSYPPLPGQTYLLKIAVGQQGAASYYLDFEPNVSPTVDLPELSTGAYDGALGFTFTLFGEAGVEYEIQTSSDLQNWSTWTNVLLTSPGQTLSDKPIGDSHKFYRAKREP